MPTPEIALQAATQYVTNIACAVLIDGASVRVAASTRLPEGVTPDDIARLLRFNVIRPYEPEPEPEPEPVTAPVEADEPAERAPRASRTRKKQPAPTEE